MVLDFTLWIHSPKVEPSIHQIYSSTQHSTKTSKIDSTNHIHGKIGTYVTSSYWWRWWRDNSVVFIPKQGSTVFYFEIVKYI
jgi:hypothetical protein